MSPYIRTVRTASGATAVQVVYSEKRGSKSMKHLGSAHTDEDLALLKAQARRLVDGDQMSLALGVDTTPSGSGSVDAPVPITSERAGHLLDVIHHAYTELGLDTATGGDQVFRDLLIARIVQPGSTFDSIETLAELGVASASYPTINRRLPAYATGGFRDPGRPTSALI